MSFIMVDRICEISASGIKTMKLLSIAEPVYEIHFPFFPVLPAVLLLENVKQSIDLFIKEKGEAGGKCFMKGIRKLKVYKAVYPGDVINTEIFLIRKTDDTYIFEANIYKNETITAKLKEFSVTVEKESSPWENELQSQV
ncbi:hypothetical protein AALB39_04785 [Lachnospiraceae bacterium 54-53]